LTAQAGSGSLRTVNVRDVIRRLESGQMEYLVVVERGKSSFGAYVPDLPGCVAVGETRREVLKLIRESIELHIEALRDADKAVPPPMSRGEVVKIRAA
jgi:predicted RNase H-like HicB family nuclease